MSPELEDFRQRMVSHARLVDGRSSRVESEASTNTSLVQPFLAALGYDVGNPDEVSPEHHADFSDKYQNKVDYAIIYQGKPVVALESKRVGSPMKDDRGQLRSYFNASPTVKLGILTDGLRFEFYADSDKPNMMDDIAFLRFDFTEVAKSGSIDDNTLEGIAAIRKGLFNPDNVGAEAKRKLLVESIVDVVKKFKNDPPDEFIRLILGQISQFASNLRLTQRIVESNREVIKAAMHAFVERETLGRLGYAPKDVVKAPIDQPELSQVGAALPPISADSASVGASQAEQDSFNYAKSRLMYLVKNDVLFREIEKVKYRKLWNSFRVYYDRPNKGSLFDYRETKDGKVVLQFPALDDREVPNTPSPALDDCLIKVFAQRVTEAGISIERVPVLRAVPGGYERDAG